ncbi:hypothetical protein IGJ02_000348 [Enterococcus sp. DIV0724b]|uniref:YccF domain-containing protein n=1 Tax=Enterococcus sp. DIV0724b TaxID=2774694 RepID=UPI003D2FE49E
MSVLDWLFIGLLSSGFVSILVLLFVSTRLFSIKRTLNMLNRKRPKTKQKRRWLKKKKYRLQKQNRFFLRWLLLLAIFGIVTICGALYARYYQSTNLTAEDSNMIVQSYFVTEEVNTNLKDIERGGSIDKIQPKLRDVSSLLVSYGNLNLAQGMSEEGTSLLIRYKAMMKELGTNIYALSSEDLANAQLVSDYQKDLEKLTQSRKKVFDYFKINELALKQKK